MEKPLDKIEATKDVSIIIVNWNTKDLLLSCIRSLKNRTRNLDYEIIVVDNASADGSQEAMKLNFPDVTLIQNKENLGFGKANNIGIQASSGRYLCLVNSDVEIKEGCIDHLINFMEQHPEAGMAGPKIYYPDGRIQISCKQFPSLWNYFCEAMGIHNIFPNFKIFSAVEMNYFNHNELRRVDVLMGAFWAIRREALEDVGLLDERFFFYSEDTDWCRRFRKNGWEIFFYPESEIIHYHGGSSSGPSSKYLIQLRRAKLQYWMKHHSRLKSNCARIILILQQVRRILLYAITYIFRPLKREKILEDIKSNYQCLQWLLTNK
jgi:GT2 family glycosyltransferase